jgi:hypothetical protein
MLRSGLVGLALALPYGGASAIVVPQENRSEMRARSAIAEAAPLNGEIQFDYDTALNKTRARFTSSLVHGHNFLGVIRGRPPVHTIIAVYQFAGRAAGSWPESVQLSFVSEEFRQLVSEYPPARHLVPIFAITLRDSLVRYPVGVAQRTEILAPSNTITTDDRGPIGAGNVLILPTVPAQARIERTATVRIPVCDFLLLIRSSTVRGSIVGLDFELDERVLAGLREFAGRLSASSSQYCR